ncbi:MAG: alanyl-tRNA editing protein [Firmicutes bacterium]|nr:alanyl-tRNA editing protein [Bacillota bacterium]
MEHKLYYQDAYIEHFSSRVKEQHHDLEGNWYVTLEQTAFYPTGGGQPHDIGFINEELVTNVEEIDGEIRHYIQNPVFTNHIEIDGKIDWIRRYDFMQQHAGQHVLTAAFVELFDIQTTSFHLGEETVTIDLNCSEIDDTQLLAAEELANRIIMENRPIETKWVTKEQLEQYPLRKKVKVDQDIRLVIIPEFDYNGCGGTHPRNTAEIAMLKILKVEKQNGQIRIHFVCGNRIRKQLHKKQKAVLEMVHLLSSSEEKLGDTVKVLLNQKKVLEKQLAEKQQLLIEFESKELVEFQQQAFPLIHAHYHDRSIQDLQKLAQLVVAESPSVIVLLIARNEQRLQVVLGRGQNLNVNLKAVLSEILPLINGKGGGSESFVQGGGIDGTDVVLFEDTCVNLLKNHLAKLHENV